MGSCAGSWPDVLRFQHEPHGEGSPSEALDERRPLSLPQPISREQCDSDGGG